MTTSPAPATPGLWKRLACAAYEGCLLFGVCFITSYLFLTLSQSTWPLPPERKLLFQLWEFGWIGAYFVWFWRRGGQTLALKTWHLRLVARDGGAVVWWRAALRYVLSWAPLLPAALCFELAPEGLQNRAFGLGLLLGITLQWGWAVVDRERQFLHDRLLGTRFVGA
ncbi:RDD family protein [Derxia gummosa]|uniref:RDD family protein n=1 Tax=Derxia gummosa DSM 723 TaxID=1121388 RepID=A0A9U5FTP8_9BURK|nr:RDD family protein [Derxia gummosa]